MRRPSRPVVWAEPARVFFAQSWAPRCRRARGRVEIDQREVFEGNSVLRAGRNRSCDDEAHGRHRRVGLSADLPRCEHAEPRGARARGRDAAARDRRAGGHVHSAGRACLTGAMPARAPAASRTLVLPRRRRGRALEAVEPSRRRREIWEAARRHDRRCTCAISSGGTTCTARSISRLDATADLLGRRPQTPRTSHRARRGAGRSSGGRFGRVPALLLVWGPNAGHSLERWIAEAARYVYDTRRPTLTLVYLPQPPRTTNCSASVHTTRRFATDLRAIDDVAGELIEHVRRDGRASSCCRSTR